MLILKFIKYTQDVNNMCLHSVEGEPIVFS